MTDADEDDRTIDCDKHGTRPASCAVICSERRTSSSPSSRMAIPTIRSRGVTTASSFVHANENGRTCSRRSLT
jgi:hypothetical protein